MAGLAGEVEPLLGSVAEYVSQAGFYALVKTEYEGTIYIRSLSAYLLLKDSQLTIRVIREAGDTVEYATINLADPDSLDRLLEVLFGLKVLNAGRLG